MDIPEQPLSQYYTCVLNEGSSTIQFFSVIFKMGTGNPNGKVECCHIKWGRAAWGGGGGGESLIGIRPIGHYTQLGGHSHKGISHLRRGLEMGWQGAEPLVKLTCHSCPSCKHFPPTPCFFSTLQTLYLETLFPCFLYTIVPSLLSIRSIREFTSVNTIFLYIWKPHESELY
jgi:hypothetical protein